MMKSIIFLKKLIGMKNNKKQIEVISNFYGSFFHGSDYISKQMENKDTTYMWDGFLRPVFDKYIDKNSLVLEIGANIGAHTVYLSQISKQVIAFEPQQYVYYQLSANLFINKCINVSAYNLGIYNKECMISPEINIDHLKDHTAPMITLLPSSKGIQCITIDSLNENFSFIKIDAQGADLLCLEGAIKTIEKFKPVIAIEIESDQTLQKHGCQKADYFNFFNKINYKSQKIEENNYLLTPKE